MIQRVLVASMLALLLVACGRTTTVEPTTVPTDVAVLAPTDVAMAEPTVPAEDPATNSAGGDMQRFVIVPEESQVQYEVDELFIREGNILNTAIGVTQIISGEVLFDRANPQNSTVGPLSIDISAFASDSERRDQAIRDRWLESARFPIATFTPTAISGLPTSYTDGEEVTLQITGDLTVRETTQPVTFDVSGQIEGDTMRGTATTDLKMSDFGFDPPDIAGVLRSEDDVVLIFDFVARAE